MNLLPKTHQRRKTRVVILHVELYREPRAANWRLAVRSQGVRTKIIDTHTSLESAACEFAQLLIRSGITRHQPAASSQQPAASSQQPAASSQQPAASSQQPAASSQQPAASSQQPALI